jgi:hypothetical protein
MKNAATLEISDLIQFLRQELSELPDTRKPGNNTNNIQNKIESLGY